jgi:hypothetical protein
VALQFEASKSMLMVVELGGEACPLSGEQLVKGKISTNLPSGQTEQASHEFTFTSTGEFKLGSFAGTLTGSGLAKLASGKTWSYH